MHKTRAAVLILFLASTLAFGGQRSQNFWPE